MTAAVFQLPGTAPAASERPSLNLTADELVETSGGYLRPGDQLKALHERGFTRAWRRPSGGPVILERAHYEAVVRGQFGSQAAAADEPPRRATPDRAGFRAKYGRKVKA